MGVPCSSELSGKHHFFFLQGFKILPNKISFEWQFCIITGPLVLEIEDICQGPPDRTLFSSSLVSVANLKYNS